MLHINPYVLVYIKKSGDVSFSSQTGTCLSFVHEKQRTAAEGRPSRTNSLPVSVALCDDNKDNFLQDNGAKA